MDREEAINVVKCNWPEGQHQLSEALKTLIPELQESEDERIRKEIVGFIDNVLKDKNVLLLVADRIGDNIPSMIPDWIAYLERQEEYIDDIRQYAYNKGLVDAEEKQKPAEWSEEDEKMLKTILDSLNTYAKKAHPCLKSVVEDEIAWLKSLRPQPHWKPSAEQMRYLLAVINEPNNAGAESCHLALQSLYSDLKNL